MQLYAERQRRTGAGFAARVHLAKTILRWRRIRGVGRRRAMRSLPFVTVEEARASEIRTVVDNSVPKAASPPAASFRTFENRQMSCWAASRPPRSAESSPTTLRGRTDFGNAAAKPQEVSEAMTEHSSNPGMPGPGRGILPVDSQRSGTSGTTGGPIAWTKRAWETAHLSRLSWRQLAGNTLLSLRVWLGNLDSNQD
jgi:hypothetical protein